MKIYISKEKDSIIVTKETALQSILTDIASALVIISLIGGDIAFSLLVARSWVLDVFVVIVLVLFALTFARKKKKEVTREELKELIENI